MPLGKGSRGRKNKLRKEALCEVAFGGLGGKTTEDCKRAAVKVQTQDLGEWEPT